MAKEKPSDPDKAARKAEKKAKKEASTKPPSSSKKDKAAKAKAIEAEIESLDATTKLLDQLDETAPGSIVVKDGAAAETKNMEVRVKAAPLLGALVPFANPLADEKVGKKVLKSVKKANKSRALKRGVKEVVKALRKSPSTPLPSSSSSNTSTLPPSIVVLAADISPMDVISHIPVLCEDHHVPYIFVPSRAELGAASLTKRPTSVVMVGREKGREKRVGAKKDGKEEGAMDVDGDGDAGKEKEKGKEEGGEEWADVYAELVRVVGKAGQRVRI